MEKWCIKVTKENQRIVGPYYDKKCGSDCYTTLYANDYLRSHNEENQSIIQGTKVYASYKSKFVTEEYPEITLEKFLELIGEKQIEKDFVPLIFN